jgi:hypothetical protein
MRTIAILLITAASCCGSAIVTTSTVCTLSCDGPETMATANVAGTSVSAEASYMGRGSAQWISARATAILEDDYMLTLHGGTGIGLFTPCFSLSAYDAGYSVGSGSSVTASFGLFEAASYGGCGQIGPINPLPFDTPTQFHLRIFATAYADDSLPHGNGASASASFNGIRVQQGITFTLESTLATTFLALETPEPAGFLLVGLALSGLLLGLRRANALPAR